MNLKELAEACRKMRMLQKLYFRTKGQQTLEDCKVAEKKLDEAIAAILDPPEPDLFNQEIERERPA